MKPRRAALPTPQSGASAARRREVWARMSRRRAERCRRMTRVSRDPPRCRAERCGSGRPSCSTTRRDGPHLSRRRRSRFREMPVMSTVRLGVGLSRCRSVRNATEPSNIWVSDMVSPLGRPSLRKVSIMFARPIDPRGERYATCRAARRPTRRDVPHLVRCRRARIREDSLLSRSNFAPSLGCAIFAPSLEVPGRGDRHYFGRGSTHRQR